MTVTRRLSPAPIIVLAAALLSLVAIGTERPATIPLAIAAAALGLVLTARARRNPSGFEANTLASIGDVSLAVGPGAFVVYFSFNGGGYFPGSIAFVSMLLAIALALRVAVVSEPINGLGPMALLGSAALALLALWTLLSGHWSHAPGRSLVEFDRVLLYLLALVLFATAPRAQRRLEWIVRGLAIGGVIVCAIGLITRVLPDVWPIAPDIQRGRLSYPITYWNSLGLLAALTIVFCAYLTTSEREHRVGRVLAAAALPPLAATLYFTFSRGGIAVAAIGLVAYIVLARPRGLLGGLLATVPASAIAVAVAYGADRLASNDPTSHAAASQGHRVAAVVVACALGAAVIRLATLPLDHRLARMRLRLEVRRQVVLGGWGLAALLVVGALIAGHGTISRDYHRFVHGNDVKSTGDLRQRLTNPGNNKRIEQWKVGWHGYKANEFHGNGAGTYQNLWYQHRKDRFTIVDAHSLYVEMLDELGVVGFVLLVGALLTILVTFARGIRGRGRYLYAALFAAGLAWTLRAGVDWDWEMPAVTLWLFAAGGAALATHEREQGAERHPVPPLRASLSLACLALAALPAAIAVSQNRIDTANRALARGDCGSAMDSAHSALDMFSFRPEPYRVLAYCEARRQLTAQAASDIGKAVSHDPGYWQYRYDQALILAAGGRDPSAAAAQAAQLNPLDPKPAAVTRLERTNPARLRSIARTLVGVR